MEIRRPQLQPGAAIRFFLRSGRRLNIRVRMMHVSGRAVNKKLLVSLAALLTGANISHALDAKGVLVLYNNASQDGREIADYYASVHPGVRLLGLSNVPTSEEITVS